MNSKDALATLKYIIGASNIPDSAQEKASECIKEIKKDLEIFEIIKHSVETWSNTARENEINMDITLKFCDLNTYHKIYDWLSPQRKKVGDRECIQGDDGCSGCVLGLLNCVVSYPETETLQQVFDDTVKMMDYKNKNIIQAIQEELNKDAE